MSSENSNPPDQSKYEWICSLFSGMKLGVPSFLSGGGEFEDEVERQENRAAAMLDIIKPLRIDESIPATERQSLLDDIDSVRNAASANPLNKEDLDNVAPIVARLPYEVASASDRLEKRRLDIAAHKNDAEDLPTPMHALDSEIAALQMLREAVAFNPSGELTDDMVEAAAAALFALQEKTEEVAEAATKREEKRATLDARLVRLVPPISATGKEVLALLKAVGLERKTLATAEEMQQIEASEIEIKKFEEKISEINELNAARIEAERLLSDARALVRSNSKTLEAECYEQANKMLGDAAAKIDNAKKVSGYDAAKMDIAKIGPWLTKAAQYYVYMIEWRYKSTFYIQSIVPADNSSVQKDIAKVKIKAMEEWQKTLLTDASALARAGKPDQAKQKLDEFYSGKTQYADPQSGVTDVAVDAAKNIKALQLADAINDFASTALDTVKQIGKLGLPEPTDMYRKQYDAAKRRGCDKAEYDDAISDLTALKAKMADYQTVIDKYLEYVGAQAVPAVASAIGEMETELRNENFAGALGKLTALDATAANKEAAAYASKRAALKKSVVWLLRNMDGGGKATLQEPWDEAETEASHVDKMSTLSSVESLLPDCRTLVDARREAESLKAKLDASDTYSMLDAAEAHRSGGRVAEAATAYQDGIAGFARLANHTTAVANLTRTRDALPDKHSALKLAIDETLTEAQVDALAQRWDDADNKLRAVLDDPEAKAQITLIERFDLRCKKLERTKKGVLKLLQENATKKRVEEPWTDALDLAQNHKYIEASEVLDTFEPLLAEARAYAAAATRARRALAAMDKIATKVPSAAASIYALPNDKAKLDNDMVEAERDAKVGDYVEGKKKFDAICLAAQDGMKAAATAVEDLEGGHYVEAHGPGTTPEQQKTRLLTGVRPDGKKVPTNTASQFNDIGDLLATREMALETAASKDPRVTGTTVKTGEGLEVIVETDLPLPVGESFQSDTPKKEYRAGEFKEGRTFENYEHVPGLTRVFTKLIFVFDNPHDDKRLLTFDKARTVYYNAGQTPPPDRSPAEDWPGSWVVHQHYPTPKGFDPVTGEYSS